MDNNNDNDNLISSLSNLTIATHDINDGVVGNNAAIINPSGETGRYALLVLQGPNGDLPIDFKYFIDNLNKTWSNETKKKHVMEATIISKMHFTKKYPNNEYVEPCNLKYLLDFDIIKEALMQKCFALQHNTAQEYYNTHALLYLNHYAYVSNYEVRQMYEYCRIKMRAHLEQANQIRRDNAEKRKTGYLDIGLENAFKEIMNKGLMSQLYRSSDTKHKILHRLLTNKTLCCRNELKSIWVYIIHDSKMPAEANLKPNRVMVHYHSASASIVSGIIHLDDYKTAKVFKERIIDITNDKILLSLIYADGLTNEPHLLLPNINGTEHNSASFTKFVKRHFNRICKSKITTTVIRKYFASVDSERLLELQNEVNGLLNPFCHGGKINYGIHEEYMHKLPKPDKNDDNDDDDDGMFF